MRDNQDLVLIVQHQNQKGDQEFPVLAFYGRNPHVYGD